MSGKPTPAVPLPRYTLAHALRPHWPHPSSTSPGVGPHLFPGTLFSVGGRRYGTTIPNPEGVTMATDLVPRSELALPAIPEGVRQLRPLLGNDEAQQLWKVATALAQSQVFKSTTDEKQAYAKILIGRDLGLSPTQSLMTLDIVEGSIFMRGVLLAGFVRNSPQYHYKVIERTNERCRLWFLGYPQDEKPEPDQDPDAPRFIRTAKRWWEVLSLEEFSIEDARRAGLVKADKPKSGWMAHPKNMCFWRCISNAVKMEAPDLLGGMPVYTEADSAPSQAALTDGGACGAGETPLNGDAIWADVARAAEGDVELIQALRGATGAWPLARVEMTLRGRDATALRALAEQLTAQAAVEKITDADVLDEDEDAEPAVAPLEEQLDDQLTEDPPEDQLEKLAVLRLREEHLTEALAEMNPDDEQYAEVLAELEFVREEIEGLGGGKADIDF